MINKKIPALFSPGVTPPVVGKTLGIFSAPSFRGPLLPVRRPLCRFLWSFLKALAPALKALAPKALAPKALAI